MRKLICTVVHGGYQLVHLELYAREIGSVGGSTIQGSKQNDSIYTPFGKMVMRTINEMIVISCNITQKGTCILLPLEVFISYCLTRSYHEKYRVTEHLPSFT